MRRAAGELVLGRQLIDLVLLAEPLDELQQVPGEPRAFVARAIPEPLQVVELLLLERLLETLLQIRAAAAPRCPGPDSCGGPP